MKFKDIQAEYEYKNKDSYKDGKAISDLIVYEHGLETERFKNLTYPRMMYIEELLCSVIQNLSKQLSKLIEIRNHQYDIKKPEYKQ